MRWRPLDDSISLDFFSLSASLPGLSLLTSGGGTGGSCSKNSNLGNNKESAAAAAAAMMRKNLPQLISLARKCGRDCARVLTFVQSH